MPHSALPAEQDRSSAEEQGHHSLSSPNLGSYAKRLQRRLSRILWTQEAKRSLQMTVWEEGAESLLLLLPDDQSSWEDHTSIGLSLH